MTARLHVTVRPGARCNQVIAVPGGTWCIRVAAPPVDGKANRELIGYLARLLGCPSSAIQVIRGTSGRHKTIEVDGLTLDQVMAKLRAMHAEEAR